MLNRVMAIESTPLPIDGLTCTYDLFKKSAENYPDTTALSNFAHVDYHQTPSTWTYSQLLTEITQAANLFRRLGVERHDVVAYITPNFPETIIAMWGIETAGIAFAVNPMLEGAQIGELLKAAKVSWVVTADEKTDPALWERVWLAIHACDTVKGVLTIDGHRHVPGYIASTNTESTIDGIPVLDLCNEMCKENGSALNFDKPQLQDIAAYFCTGGTTGLPKIAQHTHQNEISLALQLFACTGTELFAPNRTMLIALPLFHVNAQVGSSLTAFAHGGHILLAPPAGYRAPDLISRFWEVVEAHRVCSFSGVPTVFAGLLQAPREGRDLSSLTASISGAAPMPVELFKKFEAETGLRILEAYGLTEGTCASSVNPINGESRIGSIGQRLPWQPMQAMILDDAGEFIRQANIDEVGAICISGPNVFPGYLNPDHNKGVWVNTQDADGQSRIWFNTGDLGRMDADGYFWLTGRKKELIIRGGHNIDPKIIEEVLAAHPAVNLCAAVGRPDLHAGEVPVAYVQLRAGHTASEGDLLAFVAERISERAAIPKAITVMAQLPITAVGKLFKPSLVMLEIEQIVRSEAAALEVVLDELIVRQDEKRGIVASYQLAITSQSKSLLLAERLGKYTFGSEAL